MLPPGGTAWQLSGGIIEGKNRYVQATALAFDAQGELVVAGEFYQVGGLPAQNIAFLKSGGKMKKSSGHKIRWTSCLILLAIILACLALSWMWSQDTGLFAPNPPYKPYSFCPPPYNSLPANGGWSAVVPDFSWDGWDPPRTNGVYDSTSRLEAVAINSIGQVYVAGNFSQIGGLAAGGIARWDPGSLASVRPGGWAA